MTDGLQTIIPCFTCGKELERVSPDIPTQPYGGVIFDGGRGNYGSRLYDFESEDVIIIVCDECLEGAPNRIARRKELRTRPEVEYRVEDGSLVS